MEKSRLSSALEVVLMQAHRAVKEGVYQHVQEFMSESACDQVVQGIVVDLIDGLKRDYVFRHALTTGDLFDENSKLNANGIVKAIHDSASATPNQSLQMRLQHLASNARLIFGEAKMLKKEPHEHDEPES